MLPILIDPDAILRPAAAYAFGVDLTCFEHGPHRHAKAQLIYSIEGMLSIEAQGTIWIPPPGSAVWIPGGIEHRTTGIGRIDVRLLFVDAEAAPVLSEKCCIVSVPSLVDGLLARMADLSLQEPRDRMREERIVAVLKDELFAGCQAPVTLPIPSDARLKNLTRMLRAEPSLRLSVDQWGERIGMAPRTLSRNFQDETGLSLGAWRRQLHVSLAIQRLGSKESVTNIALDLGYESPSAFIAMFKRSLGTTPARFILGRRDDATPTN
jgi:AraC-like DNA-binding protein